VRSLPGEKREDGEVGDGEGWRRHAALKRAALKRRGAKMSGSRRPGQTRWARMKESVSGGAAITSRRFYRRPLLTNVLV